MAESNHDKITKEDFRALMDVMAEAINAAYDRGFLAGKAEATRVINLEMMAIVERVLKPTEVENLYASAINHYQKDRSIGDNAESEGRAERGSIRPRLFAWVVQNPGMDAKAIALGTGIKDNSTRGGLNILRQEGLVEKRGETWFPATVGDEKEKEEEKAPDGSGASEKFGDVSERLKEPDYESGEPDPLQGKLGSVGSNPTVSSPIAQRMLSSTSPLGILSNPKPPWVR